MEVAEKLRELANELRKTAAGLDADTESEELDPDMVRDFLIFYGGGING